jgi:pimeloyl-ACP methyl ester carboxylesterase
VWVDGVGPPLVMVHGSLRDHSTFAPLVDELRDQFTTYAVDRRGFGASEDAAGYSIEQEFRDVADVVDAVATRTGERVVLWGHSYGAGCAMGGAALTHRVSHLVLFEPGLGLEYPIDSIGKVERAVSVGDMDQAVTTVLTDILEMSDSDVAEMRATERWQSLIATGPTVARECRTEHTWVYEAGRFDAISAPTLMIIADGSPPDLRRTAQLAADAIPGARVHLLEQYDHLAPQYAPSVVADVISEFVAT